MGCSLLQLDLHGNALSGTVPLQLASLSRLYSLNLAYNQFTGSVPAEELGSLTALKYVYLSGNLLSGAVTPGLCQLGRNSSITDLVLNGNMLNGTLDVSGCVNLFFLDASVGTSLVISPITLFCLICIHMLAANASDSFCSPEGLTESLSIPHSEQWLLGRACPAGCVQQLARRVLEQ